MRVFHEIVVNIKGADYKMVHLIVLKILFCHPVSYMVDVYYGMLSGISGTFYTDPALLLLTVLKSRYQPLPHVTTPLWILVVKNISNNQ